MRHFKNIGLRLTLCLWILSAPSHAALVKIASTTAQNGEGGYGSAVIDITNGYAFFGSSNTFVSGTSTFSAVTSIALTPFATAGDTGYYPDVTNLSAAALDTGTHYAYFASTHSPSNVETFSTSGGGFGVPIDSMTFESTQNSMGTMVIDAANHFAYFGTQTSPSIVVKVQLPDGLSVTRMSIVSSITLPSGLDSLSASVIDTQNGFAYFASSTTTGAVAKIKLSNFTLVGTLTFDSGEGGVGAAVIDTANQFAYFGTHDSPGKVVKVRLSNFTRSGALTMDSGSDDLVSGVIDTSRHFAYFGTNTSSGIVVPIYLTTFAKKTAVTLDAGDNFLRSAVIDATQGYAYFGTYTTPGHVIQMDLVAGVPEILLQPQNAIIHSGENVSLTVTADGRSLTYQWQRNGVDISGATSAIYTFVAAPSEDQALYRCVMTNGSGSTTSSNSLITVIPDVRVYPNPWRVDRHSAIPMTIDGILPNSTIKIFNLAAHWIKTLPPGVTTWDLTNDAGQPVASGYYFVLVTTGIDNQTSRTKIAIIR